MDGKRIDYLDGLKGIAALAVFVYHIAIVAFNVGYVGFCSNYGTDAALAKQVVFSHFVDAVFSNNSLGLYLFFVMIAVFPILSYRKHENDALVMGRYAVKRYFQLLAPCLAAGIPAAIFYWNRLFFFKQLGDQLQCNWLYFSDPIGCDTVWGFLKTTLFSMWFSEDEVVLSPMWCMNIIFLGSLAVYAAYALFGKSKNRYLPCILLAIVSLIFPTLVYFAIGAFLAEYVFLGADRRNGWVTALLFIVGILLVKLPIQVYPVSLKTEYVCGIGAGLLLWAICRCEAVKKALSCKLLTFLGRISFEIILTHFFVMSNIGCLFYGWLAQYTDSPYLLTALDFIVMLPATILLSYLINRFVSTPVNRLLNKAVEKFI